MSQEAHEKVPRDFTLDAVGTALLAIGLPLAVTKDFAGVGLVVAGLAILFFKYKYRVKNNGNNKA